MADNEKKDDPFGKKSGGDSGSGGLVSMLKTVGIYAAIAGAQSLPGALVTVMALPKRPPSCRAARTSDLPFRNACHATHTRPERSVTAAGKLSAPGSVVSRTADDHWSPSRRRAWRSQLPSPLANQPRAARAQRDDWES